MAVAKKQFIQKKEKTVKPKKAPPKKIPKEKMTAYLENLEKKEQDQLTSTMLPTDSNEALEEKEETTPPSDQNTDDKNQNVTEKEQTNERTPAIEDQSGQTADSLTGKSTWEDLKEEKKQGFYWPVLLFALLGFIIGIAFFAYQEGIKKGKTDVFTTVSPTMTPPATPTEVVVDKKAYTISVLNGSGRGGEAAKAKTLLEREGLIVDTVGNAERSDYNNTIVQARSNVAKSYLDELITTLKDNNYDVSEPEELTQKGKADVIITIGRDKKN